MGKVLVSGLINIETTLKISGFPLEYNPVNYSFGGISTSISGVGLNIAKTLSHLGHDVQILSLLGSDFSAEVIEKEFASLGLKTDFLKKNLSETPHSVILYEESGRRQIHLDLKSIQDSIYPLESFQEAIKDCSLAILCNINFSRPFLSLVKDQKIKIASDVHVLSDLYDSYNSDFMKNADILFMSNEAQIGREKEFVSKLAQEYDNEIIVMGMGEKGALLYVKKDHAFEFFPAVLLRPIINTIGAGDALFSAFLHYYEENKNPYISLRKAICYAGWKIGEKGAAQGLLRLEEFEKMLKEKEIVYE